MNKINFKMIIRVFLMIVICILAILICFDFYWKKHVEAYSMVIDENGLGILNDYEFPSYLIEDDSCIRPYDVGDGVITFGPGITYSTEQMGIDDINSRFNLNYSLENDCIDIDTLNELQRDVISSYEAVVNKVAIWHYHHFTQDQFNGLVLLAYNSPDLFKNDEFKKVITNQKSSQQAYIDAANNYYKQIPSYEDNPNTEEQKDGFGKGWYNRIVDSSEVYFGIDYDYQNNAI